MISFPLAKPFSVLSLLCAFLLVASTGHSQKKDESIWLPVTQAELDLKTPKVEPDAGRIEEAAELLARAERPIVYVGGGVVNAGTKACALLTELVRGTGHPITLTLMGLGAYPGSDPQFTMTVSVTLTFALAAEPEG